MDPRIRDYFATEGEHVGSAADATGPELDRCRAEIEATIGRMRAVYREMCPDIGGIADVLDLADRFAAGGIATMGAAMMLTHVAAALAHKHKCVYGIYIAAMSDAEQAAFLHMMTLHLGER